MEPKCANSIKWRGHTLVCGRLRHGSDSYRVGSCRDFEFDVWYSKNLAGKYVVIPREEAEPKEEKIPLIRIRVDKERVELLQDILDGNVAVIPKHDIKSPYYNKRKHRYIRDEAVVAVLKEGLAVVVRNSKGRGLVSITVKGAKILHSKKKSRRISEGKNLSRNYEAS